MGLSEDEVKRLTGLSTEAAALRLRSAGYNELPATRSRGVLHIVADIVREPMFLLLVVCG